MKSKNKANGVLKRKFENFWYLLRLYLPLIISVISLLLVVAKPILVGMLR